MISTCTMANIQAEPKFKFSFDNNRSSIHFEIQLTESSQCNKKYMTIRDLHKEHVSFFHSVSLLSKKMFALFKDTLYKMTVSRVAAGYRIVRGTVHELQVLLLLASLIARH